MVHAQNHEAEDGSPDANDLGGEIFALNAKVQGQADEPIAADAAEEDLVKVWYHLLGRHEVDDVVSEGVVVKNGAVYSKGKILSAGRLRK